MTETCSWPRSGSYFLIFELVVFSANACRPTHEAAAEPEHASESKPPAAVVRADPPSTPSVPVPDFAPPPGWVVTCRASTCAANLANFYSESWGGYIPEDASIDTVDVTEFDPMFCEELDREEDPPMCTFEGDFDADGQNDRFAWMLESTTREFDIVAQWGHGKASRVGLAPWGHISPMRHHRGCAQSLSGDTAEDIAFASPDELAVRRLALPGSSPRDVLIVSYDRPQLIWFDDRHWRTVDLESDEESSGIPKVRAHVDHPVAERVPEGGPSICAQARKRRHAAYKTGAKRLQMQFDARKVAKDPCGHSLDLDGDGSPERVAWIVNEKKTGLRIDWGAGGVSLLGGGRAVPIDVLEGEPGCNLALDAYDDIWDVAVAPWNGTAWQLPDGGTQVPFDPSRVRGDALALTNYAGHVDLVFLADGDPGKEPRAKELLHAASAAEFRLSAVPFPWSEIRVFWPTQDQWIPIVPAPAVRRYDRPSLVGPGWFGYERLEHPPNAPRYFVGK